jgi:hypothetical protein
VILIALEGVDLQPLKLAGRPMEETACLGDLPEEERVRTIEEGKVDFPIGEELLQVQQQLHVRLQRTRHALQQGGEVHVAA